MTGSWVRKLMHRLRGEDRGGERRLEREVDEELGFHLEMRTRENLAAGMVPEEARRRAHARFGELERVRRQGWDIRRRRARTPLLAGLFHGLGHDLRFAARGMARSPGLTAVALIALTLGIGASTAVFSVVDALLLDAFPYEDADRLVSLMGSSVSRETMQGFKDNLSTLEDVTFYGLDNHELVGPDGARYVRSVKVDERFLPMLGVRPALGRGFGPDDYAADATEVILISDALWRDSFAADATAVGSTLTIDGRPQTVIGVLPAGYRVVNYTNELLMPLRDGSPREAIGLLRPGVTFEQGRAEAEGLAASFGLDLPANPPPLYYRSLYEITVGGERPGLLLLAGAVALVMMIACANVANLLLARSLGRGAEISMRAALGAGRGRLVRQLLAEGGLLGLCGGTCGVVAATWALPVLLALSPFAEDNVRIDLRVLGFALLLSLITSVLFGLAPAALIRDANLKASMRGATGRAAGSRGGRRLLNALVVAEIALALVLLVGAGLFVRTFLALRPTAPGFDPRGKLTFWLRPPESRYTNPASRARFYELVLAELRGIPGVESGATTDLPLTGMVDSALVVPEGQDPAAAEPLTVWLQGVSANYHELMDIAILRGRGLRGTSSGPPEIVLSEEASRLLWPDGEPLGKRLTLTDGGTDTGFLVVGVAADIRWLPSDLWQRPLAWIAIAQKPAFAMSFVVQTGVPPEELAAPVRTLIARLDPELPVLGLRTMDRIVYDSMQRRRFTMSLMGAFGGIAILLAAIGFYGVMSYAVGRRTHELGVRVALGASMGRIRWMVVRQGAVIIVIGIGFGLAGCLALTRVVESFLYGISPTDPATYVTLVTLVAAVGLAACYVPARRATRVDPLTALRAE